ncbi:MAG: hypothetical protein RLY35_2126 [Bacteroidota bacterium]
MAFSSILGQLITYAMMPILARVFDAQEFSIYADFFAWVIPISVLITLRIEYAIPTKSNIGDQYVTAIDAITTGIFNTILLTLPFAFYAYYHCDELWYYGLIPLAAFFNVIPQVFLFLLSKQLKTQQTGWFRILNSAAVQCISIALGAFFKDVSGLIFGFLIGQFIGLLVLFYGNIHALWESRKKISIVSLSKNYRDYIFFNTPLGILEVLQISAIVLIIDFFYGDPFPGYFYMAWRILQAPINLISNNAYLINYHYCSEAKNNQLPYHSIIKNQFKSFAILALLMITTIWACGPKLFEFVLGTEFKFSGQIACTLVIMYATQFAVSPFSFVAILENKQRTLLMRNLVQFTITTITLIAMANQGIQIENALMIYGAFVAAIHLLNFHWYYNLSKK